MAVEGFTGFIASMLSTNIGSEGRKYTPYVFSLFMFILFCNILGMVSFALGGLHPLTVTSHFTITGVLALLSFAIVPGLGFRSEARCVGKGCVGRCRSRGWPFP